MVSIMSGLLQGRSHNQLIIWSSSIDRSSGSLVDRWFARLLDRSIARTIGRSVACSIARTIAPSARAYGLWSATTTKWNVRTNHCAAGVNRAHRSRENMSWSLPRPAQPLCTSIPISTNLRNTGACYQTLTQTEMLLTNQPSMGTLREPFQSGLVQSEPVLALNRSRLHFCEYFFLVRASNSARSSTFWLSLGWSRSWEF